MDIDVHAFRYKHSPPYLHQINPFIFVFTKTKIKQQRWRSKLGKCFYSVLHKTIELVFRTLFISI